MERNSKGTIFIVDISSYTRVVKDTENDMGVCIIAKLLKAIIKANYLSFLISDIEDDAILFFRHGPAFSLDTILWQFEAMLNSFNREVDLLKNYFPQTGQLSIKLIVHHGHVGNFPVKGFSKKYRPTIGDAHYLLKNSADSHIYTLITDEFLKAQKPEVITGKGRVCELFDTGRLRYILQRTNAFPKTA